MTWPYLEHGVVEAIWPWLTNEVGSRVELVLCPVVLLLEDPQALLSCEGALEPVYPAHEVVLGLVEDLLRLEDIEHLVPPVNDILRVQKHLEILHGHTGAVALCLEQLVPLDARRLQLLDPVWSLLHCDV